MAKLAVRFLLISPDMGRGDPDAAIAKFTLANQKGPKFADPLEMWGEAPPTPQRGDHFWNCHRDFNDRITTQKGDDSGPMVARGRPPAVLPGFVGFGVNADYRCRLALSELPDLAPSIELLSQPYGRSIHLGKP